MLTQTAKSPVKARPRVPRKVLPVGAECFIAANGTRSAGAVRKVMIPPISWTKVVGGKTNPSVEKVPIRRPR
jgi:hypothetical protein